jgi:hypothetical protein
VSTFLQLCQDASRECGVDSTGPSAVTGQTGEFLRLVNWVKNAHTELQNRYPNWRWMRKPFTVNTVASTDTYAYTACTDTETTAAITRFKRWWADDIYRAFTIYLTSGGVSGQRDLIWTPYEYFKRLYKFGPQQSNTGPPIHVSVDDNNKIVLGPNPDAIYTVGGDYQRGAQVLAANADTPEMPSDFHQLPVYMAMKKFAGYESAPEVMTRAVNEGNVLMRQLELDQLPMMGLAEPLA